MTIFRCEAFAPAFVEAMIERSRLYRDGKVRRSNRLFDKSRSIAAAMMADREGRERIVKSLTTHSNEDVVVSAACYLLPIDEASAVEVLQAVDEFGVRPENRISAYYAIKEWKPGALNDIRALA